MAYGDVGGPNLDFSNMGCMGFCPEMFSFGDWLCSFIHFILDHKNRYTTYQTFNKDIQIKK